MRAARREARDEKHTSDALQHLGANFSLVCVLVNLNQTLILDGNGLLHSQAGPGGKENELEKDNVNVRTSSKHLLRDRPLARECRR